MQSAENSPPIAQSLSFEELPEETERALDRGGVDTALELSEAGARREVALEARVSA